MLMAQCMRSLIYTPLPPGSFWPLAERSGLLLNTFARSGGVAAGAFACGIYIGMTEKLIMVVNTDEVDSMKEKVALVKQRHDTTWKEQERLIQEQEDAMMEELKRQGKVITQIRIQRSYQDALKASQTSSIDPQTNI